MKKRYLLIAAILVVAMMTMGACKGTGLVMNSTSEKSMTVEADRAAAGDYAMVGSLEVAEGEQVTISSNLEKGEIQIELYGTAAEQSAEEVPEMEGEAAMMFKAAATDSQSGTLAEGSYMVKATVNEKATGTVQIDVTSADN